MAGFMAGFGKAFQSQFQARRVRDFEEDEAEKDRLFQAEERRKTRAAQREEALLGMLLKGSTGQGSASKSMAKYAPDVAWVTDRLGDVEGRDEWVDAMYDNPEMANQMRQRIEEAADKADEKGQSQQAEYLRNLQGEDLMDAFRIIGPQPSQTTEEDLMSLLPVIDEADLSDTEEYFTTAQRVASATSGGERVPTATFSQEGSLFFDPDMADFEKQKDFVFERIAPKVEERIAELASTGVAEDTAKSSEYQRMLNLFGKEEGSIETQKLMEEFAPLVIGDFAESGQMPTIMQNPLLKPYSPPAFNSVDDVQKAIDAGHIRKGQLVYVPGFGTFPVQ